MQLTVDSAIWPEDHNSESNEYTDTLKPVESAGEESESIALRTT